MTSTVTWTNLNPLFNGIADQQGVEPGSWDWLRGGVAANSGSPGEHSSFGWRHHHLVNDRYARWVIANYGHRRTYYQGAPVRAWKAVGGEPFFEGSGGVDRLHQWLVRELRDRPREYETESLS